VVLNEFDTISEAPSIDEELVEQEERQQLLAAIDLIKPEVYKEVLLLRYKFELEYSEIAGILGKEEASVRKINERALSKLKQSLNI
jgi:RNA polymerase sigma factor (sigma-70 family)